MKTITLLSLTLLTTASTFAGINDLNTDTVEIANAMAHCPIEVEQLLPKDRRFNVNKIETRITQSSDLVSYKGYLISTQEGGGFELPTKGKSLSIDVMVTKSQTEDIPPTLTWYCKLF